MNKNVIERGEDPIEKAAQLWLATKAQIDRIMLYRQARETKTAPPSPEGSRNFEFALPSEPEPDVAQAMLQLQQIEEVLRASSLDAAARIGVTSKEIETWRGELSRRL